MSVAGIHWDFNPPLVLLRPTPNRPYESRQDGGGLRQSWPQLEAGRGLIDPSKESLDRRPPLGLLSFCHWVLVARFKQKVSIGLLSDTVGWVSVALTIATSKRGHEFISLGHWSVRSPPIRWLSFAWEHGTGGEILEGSPI